MTEEIKRTVAALRNARAAGDGSATDLLAGHLARLVAEYRDALLLELEAACDQLQAAMDAGDRHEADRLFPRFERALGRYEKLCDRIRASADVPSALADELPASGAGVPR